MAKKSDRKIIDQVFVVIGIVATVVFIAFGLLAWTGYKFIDKQVHDELASQKIYFPPKGSPALDPAEFPDLQRYAGELVDNGEKAKAYANGFIGRHLEKIAGGKTYSEVSTEALKNPTDAKLQGQKATLFQGETLRGLLLGDGYAFWKVGQIAKVTAYVAFIGSAVMAVLVVLGLQRIK